MVKWLCGVLMGMFLCNMVGILPGAETGKAMKSAGKIVHSVYFSLKDQSPAGCQKLVDACQKYLTGHSGTEFFAAGILVGDLARPVNDRDFDVALTVVFKDRGSHDQYQTHPRHLKFIEENQATWKKVRVFDSVAADRP